MWSVCICDSEGPRCLRKSLVRDFETLHIFASAYSYSILFPIAGSTNNQLEIANFGTKKNLERPLFPLKQRLSAANFFRKKLHLRRLRGFCIRLWSRWLLYIGFKWGFRLTTHLYSGTRKALFQYSQISRTNV